MRLGTSSPLNHSDPSQWAKRHRELGLEVINFPLNCESDPSLIDAYAREAAKNGLTIAEVGVWRNTMSPDPQEREDAMRFTIGQLELADRLGACCCVNILGSRGRRWDGACRENLTPETWKAGVEMIREIIDAVRPKNTYFTIESMPWMYPTGPDEYLMLLEDVDRDRFAVHLDIFNWMTSPRRYFFNREFADECFMKLGKLIKSCHLKNVLLEDDYTLHLRETAPEDGGVDIPYLISLAEKYDSRMPFIIEHLDSDEAYLNSLAYVKEITDNATFTRR